jgi:ATP-dependent RNA helicase RhlE
MLDMGFIRDIKRVLALLPKVRQNLLFSATFSAEIKALADSLLNRPTMIEVAFRTATADLIKQRVIRVDRERKRELLAHLILQHRWFQVLVFMRTKHGANKLAEQLNKQGIVALAIHGNKSQGARTRALAEFKDGSLQVLVATDIAARGLDIADLPHVVNFELPNVPEDYVHRIGRTGRAGAEGEAISLVCVDEQKFLADIEKLTRRPIPAEMIAGFEPDPRIRAEPITMGGGRGGRAGASAGQGRPAGRSPAKPAPRPAPAPRTKTAGAAGGKPTPRAPVVRPPAAHRAHGRNR